MASPKSKAVIGIAVVAILAAGWFFASPLFIDEVVDEAFEFPSPAEVAAMTPAERQVSMDKSMDMASRMPEKLMDEAMPPAQPVVVAAGTFRDADAVHKGAGNATLYALPDGRQLIRFEDFRVTNGPKLVVYLAEHPDPTSAGDVLEGFIKLGDLKGNVGSQNYELPIGTDTSAYGSVVIWCELFDVLFSPAPLQATNDA